MEEPETANPFRAGKIRHRKLIIPGQPKVPAGLFPGFSREVEE